MSKRLTNTLIVFGNGLGRAIDNTHFTLKTALKAAWDSGVIDAEKQKELRRWAMLDGETTPTTEEQFGRIFVAIREANKLFEQNLIGQPKLTEEDIRSFCHKAACHFHEERWDDSQTSTRLDEFRNALHAHTQCSETSIATLNYDKLLYSVAVKWNLDDGFRGCGRWFFDPENVTCALENRKSLYLHLHGSPLFLTNRQEKIEKTSVDKIPEISGSSQSHLILNNSYYKQSDIEKSPLLKSYWRAYRELVARADRIFLVGYSGGDDHLNAVINILRKGDITRVVERRGEKENPINREENMDQEAYWDAIIPGSGLIPMDDILDFRDWDKEIIPTHTPEA